MVRFLLGAWVPFELQLDIMGHVKTQSFGLYTLWGKKKKNPPKMEWVEHQNEREPDCSNCTVVHPKHSELGRGPNRHKQAQ